MVVSDSNAPDDAGHTGDKNRALITLPDGASFEVHVSCSDAFPQGFGEKNGPSAADGWLVSSYWIDNYDNGAFKQACDDTPVPLSDKIVNVVYVTAIEEGTGAMLSATDSVIVMLDPAQVST